MGLLQKVQPLTVRRNLKIVTTGILFRCANSIFTSMFILIHFLIGPMQNVLLVNGAEI
jgi:hypothetical protein